jgi:hypothetical protein
MQETDLSVSPYHNDFDQEKDFTRMLWKPGLSVQVRELNQLQDYLQVQIERFGDNILKNGTILDGCSFQFYSPYPYAKLLDNELNGTIASVSRYVGYFARNASNVQAVIINSEDGFESTAPDLKTIYLHYRNAGLDSNTFSFAASDLLTIFDPTNAMFSVDVENGGVGFSNSDTVIFSPQLSINVSSGTFTNGEYIVNPTTGANLQIVGIDDTTLATYGQVILTVKPRDNDLANISANSEFWTMAIGDDIRNVSNTVVGTIESVYGSGANASLTTDGTGRVTNVVIVDGGEDYSIAPVVRIRSVNNSVGLSSLSLEGINYIAQIRVSNTANAVGNGYAFGVSDGYIYQKGYFLRVAEQTVIVDKYSEMPNNISVGFITAEEIVDSNEDTSLLDNATGDGVNNEFAPGADRLRMRPELATINSEAITANSSFFPIVSWSEGNPFRLQQATAYSKINDAMAERTREAHGDFSLNKFQVTTRSPYLSAYEGNTFSMIIDPGTAYINGYRVQTTRNFVLDVPKGTDTQLGNTVNVSLEYRNYIRVKEIGGVFQFSTGDTINLYDTAKRFLSNSSLVVSANTDAVGTLIGTARVRSMIYESGVPGTANAAYRLFLFDLRMNQGKNFSQVRSVRYDGTYKGIADILVEQDPTTELNVAVIHYPSDDTLLFPTGVESLQNASNTTYTYRTIDQGLAFSNAGVLTKSLTATPDEFFPYTGALSDNEMQELYIIPLVNAVAAANIAGTGQVNTTVANLVGTTTTFIADLEPGDFIKLVGNSTENAVRQVLTVANNTHLTMDSNCSFVNAGAAIYRYFPKYAPIPFGTRDGFQATVDANGNILTANLNIALAGSTTINAAMAVSIERRNVTSGTKTAARDKFVKLCLANVSGNTVGPWCLGVPDIIRLKAVYIGDDTDVANTDLNALHDFYIDHNQNQNYYDLGWLFLKPGANVTLDANTWLLVQFDCLSVSNSGFYDTTSYVSANLEQIQETDSLQLANLGSLISTWEIPEVFDAQGAYYDLINHMDFRPSVSNTVLLTGNSELAPINPSETLSFGNTADPANDKKFPLPGSTLTAKITEYLGRVDSVFVGQDGNIFNLKGTPGPTPTKRYKANQPNYSMKLNEVYVPPYPNLPQNASNSTLEVISTRMANERYSLSRLTRHKIKTILTDGDVERGQPSVYTMEKIGELERRIKSLEYYVSLTLLETDVVNRVIPSSLDPSLNRFKFGFFADDFSTQISQDEFNPQYNAALVNKQLVPNSFVWTVTTHTNGVYQSNYLPWPIVTQGYSTTNTAAANTGNTCICVPVVTSINLVHWHRHCHRHRRDDECGHRNWSSHDDFHESVEIVYGVGNAALYFVCDGPIKFKVYRGGTLVAHSGSCVNIDHNHHMDKFALSDRHFDGWRFGTLSLDSSHGNTFCSGHAKLILPVGTLGTNRLTIVVSKGRRCRKWRWLCLSYPAVSLHCVCGTPVVLRKCRYIGHHHHHCKFRRCLRYHRHHHHHHHHHHSWYGHHHDHRYHHSDLVVIGNPYVAFPGWIDCRYDQEFTITIRGLRPNCRHNFFCHGINKNHRCKYRGQLGVDLIVDAYGVLEFTFLYGVNVDQDITAILANSTTPILISTETFAPVMTKLNWLLSAPDSEATGIIDLATSNFTVETITN